MKKAKPTPKGKLLAKVKKAVGQALTKKFNAQMESLPQVDVPITSTEVKGKVKSLGTVGEVLKKWQEAVDAHLKGTVQVVSAMPSAEQAHFFETLKKGADEIYAKTVQQTGNFIDLSPEDFEAIKGALEKKLTEIAGTPTSGVISASADMCMYLALVDPTTSSSDNLAYETVMKDGAMPDSLLPGSAQTVTKSRKDAMIHYYLMVHALAGTKMKDLVEPVPKRKKGDEADEYRARLREWWGAAHVHFCALAAEVREIKVKFKKLVGFKGEDFMWAPYLSVYTTPGLMSPLLSKKPSKKAEAELEEWICHTVKTVLEYAKWAPFDKASLLKIRDTVSQHYDSTLESGGVGPPVLFEMLGKQLVMHRVAQRLCHVLSVTLCKLDPADVKLFNEVFAPHGLPAHPISSVTPVMGPIVTLNEVTDWMNAVAKIIFDFVHWQPLTEYLLYRVRAYIEEGYDEDLVPKLPMGFDAVEKLPKEGVVHRTAMRLRYMLLKKPTALTEEISSLFQKVFPLPPPSVLDKVMVSGPLESAFVKNQEELEAAFGKLDKSSPLDKYTAILLQNTKEYMEAHPEAAGVGPLDGVGIVQTMAPFNVVNPNVNVYSKALLDEMVGPLIPAKQKITQKGLATLNRFGVVLVPEPEPEPTSPGVYVKELDLKHLVPPMPADHIELSFTTEKNKGKE